MTWLIECVLDRWSPTIGDPSVMGWVTVAAYGVAGVLCLCAFARISETRLRTFGLGLGVLLLTLMLNKQLDLQSAFTAAGRCVAKLQGWYEHRQAFQFRFILGLLAFSSIFGIGLFWLMRHHLPVIWMALIGLVCLMCFIVVRAVGFHHFDAIINIRVNNVRMNWILELGGITMIALNALWLLAMRYRGVQSL